MIQSAAHEDANIIFGAVLDETMGDEVKITVIATGFRQQETATVDTQMRRERMLTGASLPTARYDAPIVQREVPIVSRVAAVRAQLEGVGEPEYFGPGPETPIVADAIHAAPIAARPLHAESFVAEPMEAEGFHAVADQHEDDLEWTRSSQAEGYAEADSDDAGDEFEQEFAGSGHPDGASREHAERPVQATEPNLIPVSRSVFDDDFFRKPARELLNSPSTDERRMPSARGFDSPDSSRPIRLHYDDSNRTTEAASGPAVAEPLVRVPAFNGGAPAEQPEGDELDIPAFLRHGH
jgi:cell division protein FtsZ